MPRFPIPEILRTPLESLFLTVKAMDDSIDVKAFLSRAIDPPKMEAMDSAWTTLVDLGAVEGETGTSRLTALGRHMSMIPVDLRLAKMLVLGAVFKCLDPSKSPYMVRKGVSLMASLDYCESVVVEAAVHLATGQKRREQEVSHNVYCVDQTDLPEHESRSHGHDRIS